MLKINLLPVRQLKKRAKAKKQLFGMCFLFVGVLALAALVGVLQAQKLNNLEADVTALKQKKASYAPTLKKMARLEKEKVELIRKTNIIKELKANSSLTVRVIDEVANRIDNKRVWLTSLNQQGSSLQLSGVALDNQTVAQFMNKLKESPYIQSVNLKNSALRVVSGRNLKSFSLNCQVAHPVEPVTDKPKTN